MSACSLLTCAARLIFLAVFRVVGPVTLPLHVRSRALVPVPRPRLRRFPLCPPGRPFVPPSEVLTRPHAPVLSSSGAVGATGPDVRTSIRPVIAAAAPTLVLPVLLVNPVPVSVVTPVLVDRLLSLLSAHPSPSLVAYVVHGFRHGFDLGYAGLLTSSRPANLRSALADVPGVSAAIRLELRRRHVAGPFAVLPFPILHCSRLGAAPKLEQIYLWSNPASAAAVQALRDAREGLTVNT